MARKKPDEAVAKLTALVASLAGKGKDVLRVSSACVSMCKELDAANASKAEASTEIGGIMNRAEGTYGLNRKALKVLLTFSKLNDAKKSDYLRTLLPGIEAMLPGQLDLFAVTAPVDPDPEEDSASAPQGATIQ
jgi:hypothetical protein